MPCRPQKNKGMMPVGSQSTEEVDQNYVPMSANSPSHHHSGSLSEPMHEPNYVPMTPSSMEFSSLGKQVPPPAHMGFRSSPKTPPRRPMLSDCQPPPVDRNLKPDRKGEEIKPVFALVCLHVSWFIYIPKGGVTLLLQDCCVLKLNVALYCALSDTQLLFTVLANGHTAICTQCNPLQTFSEPYLSSLYISCR